MKHGHRVSIPLLGLAACAALLLGGCPSNEDPKIFLGNSCVDRPDEDCFSGLCLRFDTQTAFCTQPCDAAAQDCPEEFICQPTATPSGNHCVLRGLVDNCNADEECPSGHRCDTSPGPGLGICYIPVTRGLCSPCNSNLQCPAGGGCFLATSGEQFCTGPCDGGCPTGYTCSPLPGLGEQCVPDRQTCSGGRPVCAPCRGDAECGGFHDLCVENLVSGERFCAQECTAGGNDCPAGFGCVDLSGTDDGPWQCVPNSTTCEGFCDAPPGDFEKAESQCGFGRMCDSEVFACIDADDGRLCSACADDDDCRRGGSTEDRLCMVNVGSGETFCGGDCTTDACPLGFSCIDVEAFGTTHRQCVPTRGSCFAGTGRLGDDCAVNGAGDCLTGICLDFGSVDLCSARCQDPSDCVQGGVNYTCCAVVGDGTEFDCSMGPTGGADGVCAPIGGEFGADCSPGQPPCRSGVCLDIGTARLCTTVCAGDGDCLADFRCAPAVDEATASDVNICFPSGGGVMGADCTFGPAACESKYCIKSGTGNVCSLPCDAGSCPDPWVCDENATTVDGREVPLCFPPQLAP